MALLRFAANPMNTRRPSGRKNFEVTANIGEHSDPSPRARARVVVTTLATFELRHAGLDPASAFFSTVEQQADPGSSPG
jgi:hypothetical protein